MSDLDRYFPPQGPCFVCAMTGVPEPLDGRHRIIDAIRARVQGGESELHVALDYDLIIDAVRAAVESEASR